LEAALMATPSTEIRADEFTVEQYIASQKARGDKRTHEGLRFALRQLEKSGQFQSRKVVINGTRCNAYSFVK